MVAIIDYGSGNLFSLKNAFELLKVESEITCDVKKIQKASHILIPGVGAFPYAMNRFRDLDLIEVLKHEAEMRKPLLGVCLGMQILFEESSEISSTKGLGLIPGTVVKIDEKDLKVPHMGWNSLKFEQPDHPLVRGIQDDQDVYFVHSYRAETFSTNIIAYSTYGDAIPAVVGKGNVYGAQFHPEKSGRAGLRLLSNFALL